MKQLMDQRARILVADDEPANLQILRQVLQDDFRLSFARDAHKALALAASERPDLILMDIMMPGMTGYEACRRLKADPATRAIPVIFVTTLAESEDETEGFAAGGVDYITKPVSPPVVLARVRTHLSLVQVDALRQTRLQIIQRLGMAAEYKDNETGLHVIRMSHYARILASGIGLPAAQVDNLLNAAPMHDVGKIGIPDAVLQKRGPLDADEWTVMRSHAQMGADIIGVDSAELLQLARSVALTHHEKWDGSGYPRGLAGLDIPIEGRIVAVADVFDALTSVRPYKKAWSVEDAVAHLRKESGRHFEPVLVDAFIDRLPEVLEVKERWAEEPADEDIALRRA